MLQTIRQIAIIPIGRIGQVMDSAGIGMSISREHMLCDREGNCMSNDCANCGENKMRKQ